MGWKLEKRERYALIEQNEADPRKHRGTFYISPHHVKHHNTKEFIEFAFVENPAFASKANCRAFAQNSHIAIEVYDYYTKLFNPDYETVSVYDERFDVQFLHVSGKWRSVDYYNPTIQVIPLEDGVEIKRIFDTDYGTQTLEISHVVRTGRRLKHNIKFTNKTVDSKTFRVVMKLAGITNDKVKHRDGEERITAEKHIVSPFLFFGEDNQHLKLTEYLWSLGVTGDETGEWTPETLQDIIFDVHAEGCKANIIIGNYVLAEDESLLIDPDSDTFYVGGSYDDAVEYGDAEISLTASNKVYSYTDAESHDYGCFGARFPTVTIPQGSTITAATFEDYVYSADWDDINGKVYGNDVDDANDFNTEQDVIQRTRTTANVSWVQDDLGIGWKTSPEIKTVIHEIVNRGGWSSSNALVLLFIANTDVTKQVRFYSYDQGASFASKLNVTWVSGATYTKTFTVDAFLEATKTKTLTSDALLQLTTTKTLTADGIVDRGFVNTQCQQAIKCGTYSGNSEYTSIADSASLNSCSVTVIDGRIILFSASVTHDESSAGVQIQRGGVNKTHETLQQGPDSCGLYTYLLWGYEDLGSGSYTYNLVNTSGSALNVFSSGLVTHAIKEVNGTISIEDEDSDYYKGTTASTSSGYDTESPNATRMINCYVTPSDTVFCVVSAHVMNNKSTGEVQLRCDGEDITDNVSSSAADSNGIYTHVLRGSCTIDLGEHEFHLKSLVDDWTLYMHAMGMKVYCVGPAKVTHTKTFVADSILEATQTKTFTSDAILQSIATYTKTFTNDALLLKEAIKPLTADAILESVIGKPLTADALLQLTSTKTLAADAYLRKVATKTYTLDSILKGTYTKTLTADVYLSKTSTKTAATDAILQASPLKTFGLDSILKGTYTKTFAIDGYLSSLTTKTVNVDALLEATLTKTAAADAWLVNQVSKTYTADARLVAQAIKTLAADAILASVLGKPFAADAVLQLTATKTFELDAFLQKTFTKTLTFDAQLIEATATNFTADAILQVGYTKTFTIDAIIGTAALGSGGLLDLYWRRKKKKKETELFSLVKELLEAFA